MTDDKVAGEGPYFITENYDDELGSKWFLVNGPGIPDPKMTATADRDEAIVSASIRNSSYAEGRKAAEKEQPEALGKTLSGVEREIIEKEFLPSRAKGWLCPACGRGNAPFSATCPCKPFQKIEVTCGF